MSRIGQTTARMVRNDDAYDDWSYGTEPIPCDTSWVMPKTPQQLYVTLVDAFVSCESINHELLAAVALRKILELPEGTLQTIRERYHQPTP
jgi:hypothetical protein